MRTCCGICSGCTRSSADCRQSSSIKPRAVPVPAPTAAALAACCAPTRWSATRPTAISCYIEINLFDSESDTRRHVPGLRSVARPIVR
jgi:hypothetical protein